MARTTSLSSMSVDALLKLREDIGKVLSQKADQLKDQLSRLGGEVGNGRRGRRAGLKGRKVLVARASRCENDALTLVRGFSFPHAGTTRWRDAYAQLPTSRQRASLASWKSE